MADIFVTASFSYGRYAKFDGLTKQSERTRQKAAYFADLFKLPYLEVTNGRPSFAFFNPVIRIVLGMARGWRRSLRHYGRALRT